MNLQVFYSALGLQKPLLAVQGDIFNTPADHIAFAVHWPNKAGHFNNNDGGFSSSVSSYGWDDLGTIKFSKGEVRSKKIRGKNFYAMAVHTPEENGWEESPELIRTCLNRIPVRSDEVIACVLIGGGNAGTKYKASVRNLEGMIRSYKTIALYVYESPLFELLQGTGVINQPLPLGVSLTELPKVKKYRERTLEELMHIYQPGLTN